MKKHVAELKVKNTKSKRFSIVKLVEFDFNGKFNEWYDDVPLVWTDFVKNLIKNDYIEVPNCTGGDEDYLCVDHNKKEFIWCEHGFWPFSVDDLNTVEKDKKIELSLTYLESIRK